MRTFSSAVALTAASGLLYGIAFPPHAWRLLAWVALVPWLVAIRGSSTGRAALLGAIWAHVETYVTSDCLPGAVSSYYRQPVAVGWLMLEGATLVTMVPWYAGFAVAYRVLARRYGRATLPVLAAAAWVAAELARASALGGNPWALSGYSQVGVMPVMQVADLAGVHGISFLVAWTNTTCAELWLARHDRQRGGALAAAVAPPMALVAAAIAYGSLRLRDPLAGQMGPEETIAIVQANLDVGAQWRSDMYGQNLDSYLRLSWTAGRASKAKAIFWPENALTFFLQSEPAYRAAVAGVLQPLGAELVTGGPRSDAPVGAEPRYFNSTFLVSPRGDVLAWQDKTKLLPFAEYFPLASIDLLAREFGRARQFTVGTSRPPLPSTVGNLGVIVCNEAMYGDLARKRVADGAELLLNPANDSWFASLKYSLQAFDMVRLRAVEQRRYAIRPSTAGPSAIIDAWGRVTLATMPFEQEWIAGPVRRSRVETTYLRIGDTFAVLCAAVALLALSRALMKAKTDATADQRAA